MRSLHVVTSEYCVHKNHTVGAQSGAQFGVPVRVGGEPGKYFSEGGRCL
jgi:hypothetical protein